MRAVMAGHGDNKHWGRGHGAAAKTELRLWVAVGHWLTRPIGALWVYNPPPPTCVLACRHGRTGGMACHVRIKL